MTTEPQPEFAAHFRRMEEAFEFQEPLVRQSTRNDGSLDWDLLATLVDAESESIEASLIESMAPFDTFDIVANLMLSNQPFDYENYKESEFRGMGAIVEYAAALCLRRSTRSGTRPDVRDDAAHHVEGWNKELNRLLNVHLLGHRARFRNPDEQLARLRFHQLTRELFLRNPSYEWQEENTLRLLFGDGHIARHLESLVGLNIEQVILLARTIASWPYQRFADALHQGQEAKDFLWERIREFRDGQEIDAPSSAIAEVIERLSRLPDEEVDDFMLQRTGYAAWHHLGDTASFSVEEMASTVSLPAEAVRSFVSMFSQSFGQDEVRDLLREMQTMRAKPLLLDENRYLCTLGGDLLWSIRYAFEDLFLQIPKTWARYDRHRAKQTEKRALEFLSTALKPDLSFHSLTWDGGEIDGLLIMDRKAVTLEVKAGRFTEPARRGAPDRFERNLRDLVSAAHDQARRARQLLLSGKEVTFKGPTGKPVPIDTKDLEDVMSVTITLDEIGSGPQVWEMVREGVLLKEAEAHASTMSLADLELVCDVLDSPSLLLHYLDRRRTFDRIGRMVASEEADLVMHYIKHGLYLDEDTPSEALTILPSLTDDLDAYYMSLHGTISRKSPKPIRSLHPRVDALIVFLEKMRPPGWTFASQVLLDMSRDTEQFFGDQISELMARTLADNTTHDLTLGFAGPAGGLTVVTSLLKDEPLMQESVEVLTYKNKYVAQASRWTGFGIISDRPEPFHSFLYLTGAWEADEAMDAFIESMGRHKNQDTLLANDDSRS